MQAKTKTTLSLAAGAVGAGLLFIAPEQEPIDVPMELSTISTLRVATWNVLCADCNPLPDYPAWEERKHLIADRVQRSRAMIFGFQEVTAGEPLEFMKSLMSDFNYCVSSVDNSGAHVAIFIDKSISSVCHDPIELSDNRQCVHASSGGINFYNCHFPLTDKLNTESTDAFFDSVVEPLVFMGDYNTHSGIDGYPHNDQRFLEFNQTREDENGPLSFWNIDRIGTNIDRFNLVFVRDDPSLASDHRYLETVFVTKALTPIINAYLLDEL